ncbi:MAG TPA: hypothetical protein VMB19_15305 [Silvibacterium sp.]|nr:hypothetical protein [Silvibacterium sp.]
MKKRAATSDFTSRNITLWWLGALALLLVAIGQRAARGQDVAGASGSERRPPSRAELDHAIALATAYLEGACGPDGRFAYEVQIGSGQKSSSYDIIRHEGAMYALATANHYKPDEKAVNAMFRAARFLRENYMGPGPLPKQLVVWSKPMTEKPERQYAELGGAGLGLVALAAVRELDPKSVPLKDLESLGRFVLFLQRDDGSFVDKYQAESGPAPNWESLYYPGEAALGLIALYRADHSREWLGAAAKALCYLARSRVEASTVPTDHWALIATARLLPYSDMVTSIVSREELLQHAAQICDSIVRDQFRGSAPVGLDGAFDSMGRTAPAATRLEGLLSALEFLPKGELRDKVEAVTNRGIAFLLRAQILSGPQEGGMPGAVLVRVRNSTEIRIDYVQHAVCAWIQYRTLMESFEKT